MSSIFGSIDLSKLSLIFRVVIIAIVYLIILFAIRIMYKDIKNGGKRKVKRKPFGIEILEPGTSPNLKKGAVVPIGIELTIGRKEDNLLVLSDRYISSHHAKIFLKNGRYMLEDLKSTNGVILNSEKIEEKVYIKSGDRIQIGSCVFKVIG